MTEHAEEKAIARLVRPDRAFVSGIECGYWIELLDEIVEAVLATGEHVMLEGLRDHLHGCPSCRRVFGDYVSSATSHHVAALMDAVAGSNLPDAGLGAVDLPRDRVGGLEILWRETLDAYRRLGDTRGVAKGLSVLGLILRQAPGGRSGARHCLETARARATEADDLHSLLICRLALADLELEDGSADAAREHVVEGLALARLSLDTDVAERFALLSERLDAVDDEGDGSDLSRFGERNRVRIERGDFQALGQATGAPERCDTLDVRVNARTDDDVDVRAELINGPYINTKAEFVLTLMLPAEYRGSTVHVRCEDLQLAAHVDADGYVAVREHLGPDHLSELWGWLETYGGVVEIHPEDVEVKITLGEDCTLDQQEE